MRIQRAKQVSVLVAFMFLAGCQQLSDEAKAVLSYSAITAKERAGSWDLVKQWVVAKDGTETPASTAYVTNHWRTLNLNAKDLADVMAAVKDGSKISDQLRIQLRELAKTVTADAENFRGASKQLSVKPGAPMTWDVFSALHQSGLDSLTTAVQKISSAAPPKEKKVDVKPVKTP